MKLINLLKQQDDFFEFAQKHLHLLNAEGRYSCYRSSRALVRKLSLFNQGKRLPLSRIDTAFINNFRDWLIFRMGNSHNTVVENLKTFSKIYTEACKASGRKLEPDPFSGVQMSRKQTVRTYLLPEEIDRIVALKLREGSIPSIVRDIFVTECYTGLRISDILCLKWSEYDGKTIKLKMRKTRQSIELPVVSRVRGILERYRELFYGESDYIFPLMKVACSELKCPPAGKDDNPDTFAESKAIISATVLVNLNIKKLAARAGISKRVSSHVGRHSFATMLINRGAAIYDIKELLGHHDVKVTQIYTHLLSTRKQEVMKLLE